MVLARWPDIPNDPIPSRTLTMDDWLALDEDEPGEFVDGLLEGEVPGFGHESVVAFLVFTLMTWGRAAGTRVVASGLKYVLSPRRGRMPDISVFLPGTALPARDGGVRHPASIAVEVVTPTPRDERRDRIEKTVEYAAFGIRWYWIVDPALRSFEILELAEGGGYRQALVAVDGIVEGIPGCVGLTIDLDSMWAELDALAESVE